MTLRSRKKPQTTVLKPATLKRSVANRRTNSNSACLWSPKATATAVALGLCIAAFCPPTFAQTAKPSWSSNRPVTRKQPKRSLSSTAVPPVDRRPVSRAKTTSPISSTLLTPKNANQIKSAPTPRIASRKLPTPIAQSPPKQQAPTLVQPRIQKRSRLRPLELHPEPNVSIVRETEFPRLVATPKPKPKSIVSSKPTKRSLPSVRQPGSIQLVQFEDDAPISDGLDFDSAFPEFSNEPQTTVAPSPEDIFASPQAKPEDPVDLLFKDDTPQATETPTPPNTSSQPTSQPAFDFSTGDAFDAGELPAPPPSIEADPPNAESLFPVEPKPDQESGANPFTQSGDELREEIEKSLEDLPPLPKIEGSTDEPNLPDPELPNPLKNTEDELKEPPSPPDTAGDLSETNGRNCQASEKACNDELAYLRRRERTNISIDITPSIEPREFDMTKIEQIRIEKLSKSPSKTWMDRSGQVVAEGTFEDYRNGKVVVRTVNGTMQSIPDYRLSNADRCFVSAWWELPDECHFEDEQFVMRDFRMTTFTWAAAATCHKPLYFEEVSVERYGHSAGPIVQPIASGVHFFGNIAMLPYHMGVTPTNECVYPLGYHRPGDCAPWIVPGFPMSPRGFKWQSMAVGLGIWLLP